MNRPGFYGVSYWENEAMNKSAKFSSEAREQAVRRSTAVSTHRWANGIEPHAWLTDVLTNLTG